MAHLSPGGTAVLSVFLIMAIVCPLILIKFWGPKHGAYGRRGKREWDDDDQYDRRRRKKRGAQGGGTGNKKRRMGQRGGMEEGEMGSGSEMHMHTRYRPEGDWTSSAPAHPHPHPHPLVQPGQTYAGAYGLPPPGHGYGHGSPLPLGRSDDARGHYSALPTGSGTAPGTPPPATPAPRYTPGGYRAPSSQPHTPSGLRCASLPHLAEEEEQAAAAGRRGAGCAPGSGPIAGPYAPPGPGVGYQGTAPTSPPAQSHSSWLRKSSNALGRPLELVIGPARSQPRMRNDERMGNLGGGGDGDGGQVQQLGEWKKGVPLRPLEAVVAHAGRAGEAEYLPPHTHTHTHTSQGPFVPPPPPPSHNSNQQPAPATAGEGSYFALPALPTSQALFDPQTHSGPVGGQDLGPAAAPAKGSAAGAMPGDGDTHAGLNI